jgi:hypothetical protein
MSSLAGDINDSLVATRVRRAPEQPLSDQFLFYEDAMRRLFAPQISK